MITEKQAAYSGAQLLGAQIAGALALLTGGPVAASREMIEVYRRTVLQDSLRAAEGSGNEARP
jgi:hypothetical protein